MAEETIIVEANELEENREIKSEPEPEEVRSKAAAKCNTVIAKSKKQEKPKRPYKTHTVRDCENFFKIYNGGFFTIKQAVIEAKVNLKTAACWMKNLERNPEASPKGWTKGRRSKCQLDDRGKKSIRETLDSNPNLKYGKVVDLVNEQFAGIKLNRAVLRHNIEKELSFSLKVVKTSGDGVNDISAVQSRYDFADRLSTVGVIYNDCLFVSRASFTGHIRTGESASVRNFRLMAALSSKAILTVHMDFQVFSACTAAKPEHSEFLVECLEKFQNSQGPDFDFMDREFTEEIPDIEVFLEKYACSLIKVDKAIAKLNPVELVWYELEEKVEMSKLEPQERSQKRISAAAASIHMSALQSMIEDTEMQLEYCLLNEPLADY